MHRTTTILLFSLLLGCDADISENFEAGPIDTGDADGGQEGEEFTGEDTAATTTTTALSSSEEVLSFGPPTTVGCVTETLVTISNTSAVAVNVTEVAISGASEEYSFQLDGTFPLALEPDVSFELLVRYAPLNDGLDAVVMSLYTDSDLQPALSWLGEGSGQEHGHADETYFADGASDRYHLGTDAVTGTVTVLLDDTPLSESEWSFSAESRSIIFATVPAPGAEIKIGYAILPPACD